MSSSVVNSIYQVTMHISDGDVGPSERFFLDSPDISTAKTVAAKVAGWRLCCLPASLQMDWCVISTKGGVRDGVSVFSAYPQRGLFRGTDTDEDPDVPAKTPNLISDALTLRIETGDGPWSTRWLHGPPDKNVEADELTVAIVAASVDPGSPAIGSDTWPTLVGKYLYVLRTTTKFYRERRSGDTLVRETFPMAAIIFKGVKAKKVGPRFGKSRGRANPR